MNIEFNKVTWYSKLAAVILFIFVIPWWTFYIGMRYQETVDILKQESVKGVTENTLLNNNSSFTFEQTAQGLLVKNGNELVQTIPLNEVFMYSGKPDRQLFYVDQDINFDTFQDLRIIDGIGTLDNIPTTYWIYNPQLKKFEEDPVLNGISNPEFNKDEKIIISHSRCCAGSGWGDETYEFKDNKYIL
ncbi:MAG: nitrite reductase, partial [Candidatus Paceibacter sp.]|nr:nitrite reductase [Candidatus Paceibacter sp.]